MLIRIPNWLGDALMATPVYANLSHIEPLILFGPPSFLELFEDFPKTKVLPFYKENFRLNLANLSRYREEKGLLLTNSFSSAWLFFRARLRVRMGFATDLRGLLLTQKVKPPKERMHQRDKYLYLIEKLGYPIKERELKLYLKEETLNQAKAYLKEWGLTPEREPFIILAPGAAFGPAKKWPEKYYRELALKLISQGFRVLVVGGPKERKSGQLICEGLEGAYNLCGKTNLKILAGIFTLGKALISNDSGLMHLGAALKIPQIALFGSTDPTLTGPLNERAKIIKKELPCAPCFERTCPRKHYRCLLDITPDEVYQLVKELLTPDP
uniref:lipopolysaccharide heptosyltransferase II n=1 Tax=Caldimicrobium thiodismutans TaxID=1653476 RepID=A0A832GLU9_9BACT